MSRMNRLNKLNNNNSLNKELLATFKNFNPDIVVLGHADKIHNKTLREFKTLKKDLRIIEWNVDNYFLDNTERKFLERSAFIDAFFITNADETIKSCLGVSNSISFFPNIFDSSIERLKIFENSSFDYDIFYALSFGVGTGKIKSSKSDYDREVFLDFINNNCPTVKTNFFGHNGVQPVWGAEFEKQLSKSPISLNLSRKPNLKYYSSDRISQYLGNGSCIFIDINSQLEDLFSLNEVIFFDSNDMEDFQKKIEYFSINKDEAKRIAKKGWKRGHNNYNEKIITNYFLDVAFNIRPTKDYSWPINQFFK